MRRGRRKIPRPAKKRKENLNVSRVVRLTSTLDGKIQGAAAARGIPLSHWIRQAMVEKLVREGMG